MADCKPANTKGPKKPSFARQSFLAYYEKQGIVPTDEWHDFVQILDRPLPACFRINKNCAYPERLRTRLNTEFQFEDGKFEFDGEKIGPPRKLPWYPDSCGWKLSCGRAALRKLGRTQPVLHNLHQFLISEVDTGNISRQEAVSMVPPLMLDVQPDDYVLDMCAAPGSKTAQIVESMAHSARKKGTDVQGMVIANDINAKRAYLLAHQLARVHCQALVITGHDASEFPQLPTTSEQGFFDRVLCDVPCSGDGTIRKSPEVLRKWHPGTGLTLHSVQLAIARRGATVLKVGGTMVYSTCSLNPIENESVVAALIRESKGALEVQCMKTSSSGLIRREGLQSWQVGWSRKGGKQVSDTKESGHAQALTWFDKMDEVPEKLNQRIFPSMFPPTDAEGEAAIKEQLLRCMRFLPHDQDTGGFFVVVIKKLAPVPQAMTVTPSEAAAVLKKAKLAKLAAKAEANAAKAETDIDGAASGVVAGGDVPGALAVPRTRTKYTSFGEGEQEKMERVSDGAPQAKKQKVDVSAVNGSVSGGGWKRKGEELDAEGATQEEGGKKKKKKKKKQTECDEAGFMLNEYRPLSHTQWEHMRRYFGLTASIPSDCLFSRSAGTATVWLVSPTVAKHCLRTPNSAHASGGGGLKVVQTGTRLFARTTEKGGRTTQAKAIRLQAHEDAAELAAKSSASTPSSRATGGGIGEDFLQDELQGPDESLPVCFRPAQEGLPMLLPYMTKRVVKVGLADFLALLNNAASSSNAKLSKAKNGVYGKACQKEVEDAQAAKAAEAAKAAKEAKEVAATDEKGAEDAAAAAGKLANQRAFVALTELTSADDLKPLAVGPVVATLSTESSQPNASDSKQIEQLCSSLGGSSSTGLAISLWVGTNKVNVLASKIQAEVLLTNVDAVLEQEQSKK